MNEQAEKERRGTAETLKGPEGPDMASREEPELESLARLREYVERHADRMVALTSLPEQHPLKGATDVELNRLIDDVDREVRGRLEALRFLLGDTPTVPDRQPPYEKLVEALRRDWGIEASWDGLRRIWSVGLTEEGVRGRDRPRMDQAGARRETILLQAVNYAKGYIAASKLEMDTGGNRAIAQEAIETLESVILDAYAAPTPIEATS